MSLNNSAWPTVVDYGTTNTSTRSSVRRQAYRPNALGLFTRNTELDFVPIGLLRRQKRNQPQNLDLPLLQAREPVRPRRNASDAQYTPALRVQRPINTDLLQSKRESLRVSTRPRRSISDRQYTPALSVPYKYLDPLQSKRESLRE